MAINLLPDELKGKAAKSGKAGVEKYLPYLIAAIFAVLVLAHIFLGAAGLFKSLQFKKLNRQWDKLKPQRETLDKLKLEYDASTYDSRVIESLESRQIRWDEKLNRLSLNLPPGIWFNEITASRKELILKASAISLEKEEMSLIKRFLDNLRNDALFLRGLTGIELGQVQKRTISTYDTVDFVLTAKLR